MEAKLNATKASLKEALDKSKPADLRTTKLMSSTKAISNLPHSSLPPLTIEKLLYHALAAGVEIGTQQSLQQTTLAFNVLSKLASSHFKNSSPAYPAEPKLNFPIPTSPTSSLLKDHGLDKQLFKVLVGATINAVNAEMELVFKSNPEDVTKNQLLLPATLVNNVVVPYVKLYVRASRENRNEERSDE